MAGNNSYNLILQLRDRRVIDALELMRVLDREQAMIVGPFGSTTRANTRLLALTRAGLVDRVFIGTISGGRKAIYFLPNHRPKLSRAVWRDQAFAHQLAINDTYLSLAYQHPDSVRFTRWERFEAVLSEQVPLIPDGYAAISTPTGDLSLFVEVDLGTEPLKVWERKVALYLEFATSGEFTRRFGAEQFRVLVIARSWGRCQTILRTIQTRTNKIFWATTIEAVRRQGLWAAIWTRPDGRTRLRLLGDGPNSSHPPPALGGRAGPAPGNTAQGSGSQNRSM